MRKLLTILAILGLSISFTALTARADTTVDYTVNGTFGSVTGFPSTSLSNAGDSFTLTFDVSSTALGPNPIGSGMSPGITPVAFVYTDITTPGLSVDGTCAPMAPCGTVNFFTASDGGLFSLSFTGSNGNLFMFELVGEGCFTSPLPATCVGGFTDGTPPTLTTGGPFGIDTSSFFGEFSPIDDSGLGANSVSGTVTAAAVSTPEPSSLLLLGGGFLALGGIARRRLIARFN